MCSPKLLPLFVRVLTLWLVSSLVMSCLCLFMFFFIPGLRRLACSFMNHDSFLDDVGG